MSNVLALNHCEATCLDRARLDELVNEHGAPAAERLMGRALEDIAILLNKAEQALNRSDGVRLASHVREIALVADQVGFLTLSRVAHDVLIARAQGDGAALGAVFGRLIRIGEASLMSVWDFRDTKS